jgi:outer membrane protein assembly factor BamB
VVCGTTTSGGGGAHPDQSDAHLFLWNPQTKSKELDLIPVPGAQTITDLVTAKNGLVYGIAASGGLVFGISGPGNSYTLFAYDPAGRKVIAQEKLPLQGIVYNGIGLDADGKIVGLADDEIFTIDQDSHKFRVIQKSPVKITGGFALRDGAVYFVSNSKIYRYRLR